MNYEEFVKIAEQIGSGNKCRVTIDGITKTHKEWKGFAKRIQETLVEGGER